MGDKTWLITRDGNLHPSPPSIKHMCSMERCGADDCSSSADDNTVKSESRKSFHNLIYRTMAGFDYDPPDSSCPLKPLTDVKHLFTSEVNN